MLDLDLEPELEERLKTIADQTHVSVNFVAHEAITRYLEDREDYLAGIQAMSKSRYTISQEEMERRSSVAD